MATGSWINGKVTVLFFFFSNGAELPDPPPKNAVSLPVVLQITRRQKDRGGAMLTDFCRRREWDNHGGFKTMDISLPSYHCSMTFNADRARRPLQGLKESMQVKSRDTLTFTPPKF